MMKNIFLIAILVATAALVGCQKKKKKVGPCTGVGIYFSYDPRDNNWYDQSGGQVSCNIDPMTMESVPLHNQCAGDDAQKGYNIKYGQPTYCSNSSCTQDNRNSGFRYTPNGTCVECGSGPMSQSRCMGNGGMNFPMIPWRPFGL